MRVRDRGKSNGGKENVRREGIEMQESERKRGKDGLRGRNTAEMKERRSEKE